MKLSRLFSLLSLCALSTTSVTALAADKSELGWYMGGSAGRSHLKLRTENLPAITAGEQDTNDVGYKIYGGYRFHENWAAEVQYYDLGKYHYRNAVGTIDVKTHGFAVSGLGLVPVSKEVTLFGKLGVGHQRFSGTVTTATVSASDADTKSVPLIGIGMDYRFSPQLSLRAEYEYFGVPTLLSSGNQAVKFRTDLLSVGLRYQF